MTLSNAIQHALELTGALADALERDDMGAALEILPVRGLAMERFQEAHRRAGPEELASCRSSLIELKQRDEQLQAEAGCRLQEAADVMHRNSHATPPRPDNNPCLSGCLDRHA